MYAITVEAGCQGRSPSIAVSYEAKEEEEKKPVVASKKKEEKKIWYCKPERSAHICSDMVEAGCQGRSLSIAVSYEAKEEEEKKPVVASKKKEEKKIWYCKPERSAHICSDMVEAGCQGRSLSIAVSYEAKEEDEKKPVVASQKKEEKKIWYCKPERSAYICSDTVEAGCQGRSLSIAVSYEAKEEKKRNRSSLAKKRRKEDLILQAREIGLGTAHVLVWEHASKGKRTLPPPALQGLLGRHRTSQMICSPRSSVFYFFREVALGRVWKILKKRYDDSTERDTASDCSFAAVLLRSPPLFSTPSSFPLIPVSMAQLVNQSTIYVIEPLFFCVCWVVGCYVG